jgi:ATP-dependent DNA ligase
MSNCDQYGEARRSRRIERSRLVRRRNRQFISRGGRRNAAAMKSPGRVVAHGRGADFDLIELDGRDLRKAPIEQRKDLLAKYCAYGLKYRR